MIVVNIVVGGMKTCPGAKQHVGQPIGFEMGNVHSGHKICLFGKHYTALYYTRCKENVKKNRGDDY